MWVTDTVKFVVGNDVPDGPFEARHGIASLEGESSHTTEGNAVEVSL